MPIRKFRALMPVAVSVFASVPNANAAGLRP